VKSGSVPASAQGAHSNSSTVARRMVHIFRIITTPLRKKAFSQASIARFSGKSKEQSRKRLSSRCAALKRQKMPQKQGF
jgi:hypothetical protein